MVSPRQTRIVCGDYVLVISGPTGQIEYRPAEYNFPDGAPDPNPVVVYDLTDHPSQIKNQALVMLLHLRLAALDKVVADLVEATVGPVL